MTTSFEPTQPEPTLLDLRLVPAALTSWAVTAVGILWQTGMVVASLLVLIAGGSGAAAWWAVRAQRPVQRAVAMAVLAVAVVGAGFGCAIALRADAVRHHPIADRFGARVQVTVAPTETPRALGNGRLMFRASLQRVEDVGSSGRVTVFAQGLGYGELTAGQPVRFDARISRPTRRDLTIAVLNATGEPVVGQASLLQRAAQAVRTGFAACAREVLPVDQASLLPALVLGDTSGVTGATSEAFRTAGLTHLTAVSGANVTIVCGAVLLSARLVGPRAAVALAAMALVAFVVVVQPTASVLRAAVMGGIALLAILSSRRRQAIPVLSATVITLMIVAPHLAVDAGFALSVSATAAIVVLAPVWSRRLVERGWPGLLADAVAIAAAAQLVTAPLVAGISGQFSLVAVAANLAVTAVIAPITVLGTAAAAVGLLWPAAAGLLIRFTGPELWWLLTAARWAASVPGASVTVPAGLSGVLVVALAGLATVLLWRRRWFRLILWGVVLCLLSWSIVELAQGRDGAVSATRDTIVG